MARSYYGYKTREMVSMKDAYKLFWKKGLNFKGRSRRSEFWFAQLANFLIMAVGAIVSLLFVILPYAGPIIAIVGICLFMLVYPLVTLIPSLALTVRRFHDVGFSMLLPVVSFCFTIIMYTLEAINSTLEINSKTLDDSNAQFYHLPFGGQDLDLIMGIITIVMSIIIIVVEVIDSKKERNKYGGSPKYLTISHW